MYLYNLTLQKATGITHAVHGNFSGSKQQEIVISRGKVLEIVRPDPNTGKVHTLLTCEVFGIIRSIISFRLTGGTKGRFVLFHIVEARPFAYAVILFRLHHCWFRLWPYCHLGVQSYQECV